MVKRITTIISHLTKLVSIFTANLNAVKAPATWPIDSINLYNSIEDPQRLKFRTFD
ncbi:MAG: hypothetical protein K8R74_06065 [Bacteroidales bacterium]|nr:hypothetical protein [Bacteroidales bacterium]